MLHEGSEWLNNLIRRGLSSSNEQNNDNEDDRGVLLNEIKEDSYDHKDDEVSPKEIQSHFKKLTGAASRKLLSLSNATIPSHHEKCNCSFRACKLSVMFSKKHVKSCKQRIDVIKCASDLSRTKF